MKFFPSLPLLARELSERAAQRRTYVVRVIYAVLLFAPFIIAYKTLMHQPRLGPVGLGIGRSLFVALTDFQFCGIYLFLPAMMCGCITHEKERDSLSLLLLTRLSPGAIIIQKYLGGLVPMFSFLLLSLPVTGLAYSAGGLDTHEALVSSYFLAVTVLQVGAIALFASVWCRTTVGAFFLSYGICFAWPILGVASFWSHTWLWPIFFSYPARSSVVDVVFFPFFTWRDFISGRLWGGAPNGVFPGDLAALLLPAVLFLASRWFLIRRANVPARRWVRRWFGHLDRWMSRANRAFGGIIFSRGERALPLHDPIAWRETNRLALASPVHLVRIVVISECLAVAVGFILIVTQTMELESLLIGLAGFIMLGLAIHGANAIVTERVQQCLDVLLTTPLGAGQILRQKAAVVRRVLLVAFLPFVSLIAIAAISRTNIDGKDATESLIFAVTAVTAFAIDLPLVWWLAIWLSAQSRARLPAMLRVLAGIAGCLALPSFALSWGDLFARDEFDQNVAAILVVLSPWEILLLTLEKSSRRYFFGERWLLAVAIHLFLCAAMLFAVRLRCLRRAESYLRG